MSNYIITMGLNLYVFAKGQIGGDLDGQMSIQDHFACVSGHTVHKHSFLQFIAGSLSIYICRFAIPHTLYPITQFQIFIKSF